MKKKKIILIISIILAIIICLTTIYAINSSKKSDELLKNSQTQLFKSNKDSIYLDILINKIDLATVGNQINDYWYETIYNNKFADINAAVDSALKDNEELINSIQSQHTKIKNSYSAIVNFNDVESYEIEQIKNSVKDLYKDYIELYNLVTSPSGNYTEFSNNLYNSIKNVDTNLEIVNSLK